MSHYQRIRAQWREREHLVQALRDLNYEMQEGQQLPVRTFWRHRKVANIVVNTGCRYDIGFQFDGQEYVIIADWFCIERGSPIRQQQLIEKLHWRYAYNLIQKHAGDRGLVVEEKQMPDTGEVVMLLSEPLGRPAVVSAVGSTSLGRPQVRDVRRRSTRKIKDTVHTDGTHIVEVIDAIGEECIELSADLEQRLGVPLGPRQLKPEHSRPQPSLSRLQPSSASEVARWYDKVTEFERTKMQNVDGDDDAGCARDARVDSLGRPVTMNVDIDL